MHSCMSVYVFSTTSDSGEALTEGELEMGGEVPGDLVVQHRLGIDFDFGQGTAEVGDSG